MTNTNPTAASIWAGGGMPSRTRPGSIGVAGGASLPGGPAAVGGGAPGTLPTPPVGGGGGGAGGGGAPKIGPWDISQSADPELDRARARAESYLGDLEKGAGYGMDVMQGSMQAQIDSDVERARESAAAQGIPFDEAAYRRDANTKMQGGLAQEKLGRERMRGEMMGSLQGVIGGGAENRLAKSGLELERLKGRTGAELDIYKTETQKQLELYRIAMDSLRGWMNAAFSED